jgi:hypothetical protein
VYVTEVSLLEVAGENCLGHLHPIPGCKVEGSVGQLYQFH